MKLFLRVAFVVFVYLFFGVSFPGTSSRMIAQAEVEPGVRVSSAVSVVERTSGGPVATAMHASAILDNAHMGSNVARGLVYSGQHNSVEVAGLSSALSLTTTSPVFYIRIDPEDPNDPRTQLTLLRMRPGKDTRIVLNFTANTFGGSRKRHVEEVAITKTDVADGWLKVVPTAPLVPGEYGIMFLPQGSHAVFQPCVRLHHPRAHEVAAARRDRSGR